MKCRHLEEKVSEKTETPLCRLNSDWCRYQSEETYHIHGKKYHQCYQPGLLQQTKDSFAHLWCNIIKFATGFHFP